MVVGALCMAAYTYTVGDHRALIETQSKLETVQQTVTASLKMTETLQAKLKASEEETSRLTKSRGELLSQIEELQKKPTFTAPAAVPDKKNDFLKSITQKQMARMQKDKLLLLKTRLKLTPTQEAQVQSSLEAEGKRMETLTSKMFQGEKSDPAALAKEMTGFKTLDQELETILTPEQKREYELMKKDEEKNQMETMATFEMNQTAPLLGLNEAQKDQFYTAIYQAEETMKQPDWMKKYETPGIAPSTDPMHYMQLRDKAKIDAVSKILTPDQLALYQKKLQSDAALQKEMMEKFMPGKTP